MILLVSNSRDFATDLVVAELRDRQAAYFRLDLDLLDRDALALDPLNGPTLWVRTDQTGEPVTLCGRDVRAVLYRAPTHLRESSGDRYPTTVQLARHQWAAFARSLTVFEQAKWINHPGAIYQAESKAYQLPSAAKVGLSIPPTCVANTPPRFAERQADIVAKALDTFLVRVDGEQDAFFYTQRVAWADLETANLAAMPAIFQKRLTPKIDYRVTIVGERCFSTAITENGRGIEDDWRPARLGATLQASPLPPHVQAACLALARSLGLVFAAIDLALHEGVYYFLEVNPTGEWAWIVAATGQPIDQAIADELLR